MKKAPPPVAQKWGLKVQFTSHHLLGLFGLVPLEPFEILAEVLFGVNDSRIDQEGCKASPILLSHFLKEFFF
jgi:hypothetical protein